MANIKILGAAAVVTSGITVKVLTTLKKFKPDALKLVDPETKETKFAVGMGKNGSFSNFGIVFDGKSADDKAQLTLQIPADITDDVKKKEYVQDNYGYGLLALNNLEAQIIDVMAETETDFAQMADGIQVVTD
jgi:hypothetical protein